MTMSIRRFLSISTLLLLAAASRGEDAGTDRPDFNRPDFNRPDFNRPDFNRPDFNRDVRPILSDHCFACHGPDQQQRKADLRLDTAAGISAVIDSDDPAASDLLLRLDSTDGDEVMPPPDFHKKLSDKQRAVLRAWVSGGAKYELHWAFSAPIQSATQVDRRSMIDFFLDRRIQQLGLRVNGIADRRTLLRRLYLDLTGLPPNRQQLNQFLNDPSPDAYENLVDRLLAAPHFGQHLGRYWLDLVRYGDTHGLHLDNYREMWPYRDWVINAINANMPFDQFITKQLAGDLLTNATRDDLIASGFNRLNVTTNEGGSIYDEVFARNVIDRTDAFGTVFLGMTTGCAVCHDHKFDPLTSRDFYSLSAFFNSLDGRAMDNNIKNPAPVISVPSREQQDRIKEIESSIEFVRSQMVGPIETVDAAQQVWERSLTNDSEPTLAPLIPSEVTSSKNVEMQVNGDGSIEVIGPPADKDTTVVIATLPSATNWQTLHLQAFTDDTHDRVGLSENGNVVLSEIIVETKAPDQNSWQPVPIRQATADVEQADGPFAVKYAFDGKTHDREGWAAGGHQQTGPRNAWFSMPALSAETQADTLIRIQLQYHSIYKAHQFRKIGLSLSDTVPTVSVDQQVRLGPIHSVGPFPVETSAFAYDRDYASLKRVFKPAEVFAHSDRPYRWQHRADLPQVEVNRLPTLDDQASVTVLHQSLHAPEAQSTTLLIGTDDGHQVFLNGKSIGTVRGPAELSPLSNEYKLDLKKGDNRLYVKAINHSGKSEISFAYRSPSIPVPSALAQRLQSGERDEANTRAIRNYYRKVYCLPPRLVGVG